MALRLKLVPLHTSPMKIKLNIIISFGPSVMSKETNSAFDTSNVAGNEQVAAE